MPCLSRNCHTGRVRRVSADRELALAGRKCPAATLVGCGASLQRRMRTRRRRTRRWPPRMRAGPQYEFTRVRRACRVPGRAPCAEPGGLEHTCLKDNNSRLRNRSGALSAHRKPIGGAATALHSEHVDGSTIVFGGVRRRSEAFGGVRRRSEAFGGVRRRSMTDDLGAASSADGRLRSAARVRAISRKGTTATGVRSPREPTPLTPERRGREPATPARRTRPRPGVRIPDAFVPLRTPRQGGPFCRSLHPISWAPKSLFGFKTQTAHPCMEHPITH